MTVRELIEQLSKLPQDLRVVKMESDQSGYWLVDVDGVKVTEEELYHRSDSPERAKVVQLD